MTRPVELSRRATPQASVLDCVVVVVSYNNSDDLGALLASLPAAAGGASFRVVVVDNDSTTDVGPLVDDFPYASLVRAGENLGYSGGINAGMDFAPPSSCVLVANPDIVLAPGSLEFLCREAVVHGASVPRIEDFDGSTSLSLRREPTILRALGEAVLGDHLPHRSGLVSEIVRHPGPYLRAHDVDWATGAALMVSREVAEAVGEWDSGRFFLYSEETDYCRRIRAAGYHIRYVPSAVVRHRGSGSGTSDQLAALMSLNSVRYYAKWHLPPSTVMFGAAVVARHLLRIRRAGDRHVLLALVSRRRRLRLPGEDRPKLRPSTTGRVRWPSARARG